MPLPKVKHQIYDFVIPSTGKKESFRPFLVKEEKILLMAKASDDPADSLRAVKQIVNNCGIREAFDVDTLTIFDIEYLFIQLRAVSVSNIVTLSYKDNEDNKVYDFTVDLKDIEIRFPETVDKIIKVTDTMGIVMKWPSAALFDDKDYFRAGDQAFYELILRCIDKIYDGEQVYNASEYSAKELEVFLDDCGIMVFNKIQEFMTNVPHIHHILTYTNSNGKKQSIELNGLTDFFTLR
jgi:hypothetical protein